MRAPRDDAWTPEVHLKATQACYALGWFVRLDEAGQMRTCQFSDEGAHVDFQRFAINFAWDAKAQAFRLRYSESQR